MEHEMQTTSYPVRDFIPLMVIFALIVLVTLTHQLYYGWNLAQGMMIFMASFFLIFGAFKVINLAGFAQAYSMYDLIAKRFYWYGYVYPFLELALGFAYLFKWNMVATNLVTLLLMLVSAAGVYNELKKGKHITCACLGALFKIPMTYVTFLEDLLMAVMAFAMLLMHYRSL